MKKQQLRIGRSVEQRRYRAVRIPRAKWWRNPRMLAEAAEKRLAHERLMHELSQQLYAIRAISHRTSEDNAGVFLKTAWDLFKRMRHGG